MTRGLNPPESLSADDVQTLRTVRRDIYTQGMIGGGLGACAGLVLYTAAQHAKKRLGILPNASFNRNTAMLAVFSSFAFGTFLFSSATGKGEVYKLHPVFQVGAKNEDKDVTIKRTRTDVDRQRLQHNRMTRRKTLMDQITHGQGLSDSHSGRWVEEHSETKFQKE